jgi:integrase
MFLFCFHARGMCFVDMAHLKKADLRGDTIRYRRAKTGQLIELKVLPAMRRIIDWFSPQTSGSHYLFPVITDTDGDVQLQYESGLRVQNLRLKRIAAMCGITDGLSTHVARHSWATVARNTGLPLAVISEGLGHTHQRTTEIYLASLERSVIDRASLVVSESILDRRHGKGKNSHHRISGGVPGYFIHEVGFAAFR